ncbi:hypothetical protein ACQ3G6_13290 [Allorhizobium undicola]|uniref:hypothetical protein n=1 Tax=Allorhizobium undicola TaxID=78527 RepID=UPI003D325496
MTTPSVVNCPAGQWTLIASGATSAIGIQFRNKLASGLILPTSSSTSPAAKNDGQGWFDLAGYEPLHNLAASSSDYWWFQPNGAAALTLAVWVA